MHLRFKWWCRAALLLLLLPVAVCAAFVSTGAFAQTSPGKKPLIGQPGMADKFNTKPNPTTQVTPGTKSYQNVKPPGVTSALRAPPSLMDKLSNPKWLRSVRAYSPDKKYQTIPLTVLERDAIRLRPVQVPCPTISPQQQAETEQHWQQVEQQHYRSCLESYTRGAGDIPSRAQNETCQVAARVTTAREREARNKSAGDADSDGAVNWCIGGDDCDDQRRDRYPGATEIADPMHVDEDCNPSTIGNEDRDGDGFISVSACNLQPDGRLRCGTDCDDNNQNIHPNQADPRNGIDENCDGDAE